MKATSTDQYEAATAFGVPALEQVRDDIWALGQRMPGDHLPASLLYLIRDTGGGVHVVDPGTDSPENFARFERALADIGSTPDDVRSLTATHLHPDHLGMARRIQSATGAPLRLHAAEASALLGLAEHRPTEARFAALAEEWQVPQARRPELLAMVDASPAGDTAADRANRPSVDTLLADGDRLDVPGFDLRVVHTPGHTPGSLCLHDAARGLLFTGDTVLPTVFAGLGLGGPTATNPLADYLTSLSRLAGLADDAPGADAGIEVLPGHGYRFTGLRARAAESAEHHLVRAREVSGVLAADPEASVWLIASQLTWTAGFSNLVGFQLFSALSQTAMLCGYAATSG